jgi:hypothetical protein
MAGFNPGNAGLVADLSIALRMVLSLEGIACRPK